MNNRSSQRGVGLIEVLVTLLILSTSLITLTAMQNRSLQFNQMAYFRSQANILAYDILERIRANKSGMVSLGLTLASYNIALAAFPGGAAPANNDLVGTDLFQWRQELDRRIPGAQGGISCVDATSICTVTISWAETNSTINLTDEQESTSLFTYSARL